MGAIVIQNAREALAAIHKALAGEIASGLAEAGRDYDRMEDIADQMAEIEAKIANLEAGIPVHRPIETFPLRAPIHPGEWG